MIESLKNRIVMDITPSRSQKSFNAERNVSLDLLKLIAAFLVVFYHLAYYKLDYGFAGTGGVFSQYK